MTWLIAIFRRIFREPEGIQVEGLTVEGEPDGIELEGVLVEGE